MGYYLFFFFWPFFPLRFTAISYFSRLITSLSGRSQIYSYVDFDFMFAIGVKRGKLSDVVFLGGREGECFVSFYVCLRVCFLFCMLYCTKKDSDIYRGSSIDY